MNDKETVLKCMQALVEQFSRNHVLYTQPHSTYNETQLRSDFVNQFLQILDWDVYNAKQAPQHLREVMQEDTVEIEEGGEFLKKNPDYALRLGAERKLFVEVKRPSIDNLIDSFSETHDDIFNLTKNQYCGLFLASPDIKSKTARIFVKIVSVTSAWRYRTHVSHHRIGDVR